MVMGSAIVSGSAPAEFVPFQLSSSRKSLDPVASVRLYTASLSFELGNILVISTIVIILLVVGKSNSNLGMTETPVLLAAGHVVGIITLVILKRLPIL